MNLSAGCILEQEELLNSYSFNGYTFPENTTLSLPVLQSKNGRAFQLHFLYNGTLDEDNKYLRPFAWIMIPLDDGDDHMVAWCSAMDFIDTYKYPLDDPVLANYPTEDLDDEKLSLYCKEITELFAEISEFVFEPKLSSAQVDILSRYKELFLILSCQGFYPYYNALSAEFFDWIGLILVNPDEQEESSGEEILIRLEGLAEKFKEKIMQDKKKEELFDELHDELQRYKTGAQEEVSLTVLRDIILVIDNIGKSLLVVEEDSPTPSGYKKLLDLFKDIEQDLVDVLYRHGVDPYNTEGKEIDIPFQKILSTEPTDNMDLDKTVAERLNKGWKKGNLVLRPEYISAYLYEYPEESSEN